MGWWFSWIRSGARVLCRVLLTMGQALGRGHWSVAHWFITISILVRGLAGGLLLFPSRGWGQWTCVWCSVGMRDSPRDRRVRRRCAFWRVPSVGSLQPMTVGSGTPGPGRQAACRCMCGGFPYASVRIAPAIAVAGGAFLSGFPLSSFYPSFPPCRFVRSLSSTLPGRRVLSCLPAFIQFGQLTLRFSPWPRVPPWVVLVEVHLLILSLFISVVPSPAY